MSKQRPWQEDALQLVRTLKSGGVIVSATDTVWGLACDATSAEAVARMAAIKGRPMEQSFLALVADEGQMEQLLPHLPESAWELIQESDRPVTIVGQAAANHRLAPGMVRADGSLGVRCVTEPYVQFMIRGLGKPLASTSANLSGGTTPTCFSEVAQEVLDAVDAAGKWEHQRSTLPSWMVRFDEAGRFSVLRS